MGEEGVKEALVVEQVNDPTGLSDAVHAEHWRPDVHSLKASLGRHHGADGGPTSRVILHHEVLDGDVGKFGKLTDYGCSNRIRHVPLIRICFNDYPLMDLRGMLRMMLLRVVRVHPMCHVGREHETLAHRPVVVR